MSIIQLPPEGSDEWQETFNRALRAFYDNPNNFMSEDEIEKIIKSRLHEYVEQEEDETS